MLMTVDNPYYCHVPDSAPMLHVRDLLRLYSSGRVIGCYVPHDENSPWWAKKAALYELDVAMAELPMPVFGVGSSGRQIVGSGKDRLCTPWHYYLRLDPAAAMRGAHARATAFRGPSGEPATRQDATTSSARGNRKLTSDDRPRAAFMQAGATQVLALPRHGSPATTSTLGSSWRKSIRPTRRHTIFATTSSTSRGASSEGGVGVPEDLQTITKQYGPRTTSLVVGMEELKDLLWNGYGVHCGSGIGVSADGVPVSRLQGSWSHDMQICGYDDRPETRKAFGQTIFFWDQSWGNWNRVENLPDEWKPWGQGMFALSESDTSHTVRSRERGCSPTPWAFLRNLSTTY